MLKTQICVTRPQSVNYLVYSFFGNIGNGRDRTVIFSNIPGSTINVVASKKRCTTLRATVKKVKGEKSRLRYKRNLLDLEKKGNKYGRNTSIKSLSLSTMTISASLTQFSREVQLTRNKMSNISYHCRCNNIDSSTQNHTGAT